MIYLLCFGNPYLEDDNLALNIADSLIKDKIPNIKTVKCVSPEEVLHYTEKKFYILDVVKNLKEVCLINDIDKLKANNFVSLHDFDLGFFLKLMKETGKITNINIIGIPQQGNIDQIKKEVLNLLPIQVQESE